MLLSKKNKKKQKRTQIQLGSPNQNVQNVRTGHAGVKVDNKGYGVAVLTGTEKKRMLGAYL